MDIGGACFIPRESICKGPEVGVYLACSMNREAIVVGDQ